MLSLPSDTDVLVNSPFLLELLWGLRDAGDSFLVVPLLQLSHWLGVDNRLLDC